MYKWIKTCIYQDIQVEQTFNTTILVEIDTLKHWWPLLTIATGTLDFSEGMSIYLIDRIHSLSLTLACCHPFSSLHFCAFIFEARIYCVIPFTKEVLLWFFFLYCSILWMSNKLHFLLVRLCASVDWKAGYETSAYLTVKAVVKVCGHSLRATFPTQGSSKIVGTCSLLRLPSPVSLLGETQFPLPPPSHHLHPTLTQV